MKKPALHSPLLVAVLLLTAAVGCGCATVSMPGAASFRVECGVADAGLWIDDVFAGRVSEWSGAVRAIRPGFHRIEIRHPDYFTHYAEVELRDGGAATVKAELRHQLE